MRRDTKEGRKEGVRGRKRAVKKGRKSLRKGEIQRGNEEEWREGGRERENE